MMNRNAAVLQNSKTSTQSAPSVQPKNPLFVVFYYYFVKEHVYFLIVPVLMLLLQLFILHISGIPLINTLYSTTVPLILYLIFFCCTGIRFAVRNCRFHAAAEATADSTVYTQDEDLDEKELYPLTGMQRTILHIIRRIKNDYTALQAETRKLLVEQNDYFALWIHQIKTPIAALHLLLQKMDAGTPSYFEMHKALVNIENYTQMALHYLKLHGSGRDLYFSPVPLDSILQTLLRKYRSFFIYKNISLNYEPADTTVITEAVLLEVLIEQLISNSLKYSADTVRQGKMRIYIETEKNGNNNAANQEKCVYAALIIEDNGVGIDKADLPKIFDKGYSGHNGKLIEKATGLGLYLAKEIAERINCGLEITSEYGQWTRAVVRFYTA